MLIRSYLAVLLGLCTCVIPTISAHAQPDDERDVVYEAGRNKVGLLRYCRDKALLDRASADNAMSAVEAGIAGFAPNDSTARQKGENAEKAGQAGFWEASGKRNLASLATMFGTTPAGLCQEWAKETLRHRQMDNVRQGVPADALLSTQAGGMLPAVKGASRVKKPALRAKAQLSPNTTPPAQQVVPDAPLSPIGAMPDLPERGPRASATLHQEAATPPAPENRWDSSKVAIPVPYIRMTAPSSAVQQNGTPKTSAPDASINPASRQEHERFDRRAKPWQW